jgi:hypothetical protein
MGKVLLEMSMSLDGYVAGPDGSAEAPMGRARREATVPNPRSRGDPEPPGLRVGDRTVGSLG